MDYYLARRPPFTLTVAAQPPVLETLRANASPEAGLRFLALSPEELRQARGSVDAISLTDLLSQGRASGYGLYAEWDLLKLVARRIGATRAFIPRIDTYLPLLAAETESSEIPISGILLDSGVLRRRGPEALPWKFLLSRVGRRSWLRRLFVLDGPALRSAPRPCGDKVRFLPDPIRTSPLDPIVVAELKRRHGLDERGKVGLLFGDLTARKGLHLLISAVQQLPSRAAERFTLLMVGKVARSEQDWLSSAVRQSKIRIVLEPGYVKEKEVLPYFALADFILMPYREHWGMSGVLLHAAAADRPVLATDFGLIGELVREHRMGRLVPRSDSDKLSREMAALILSRKPIHCSESSRRLVALHHPDKFAERIFEIGESFA